MHETARHLLEHFGYAGLAFIIGLESMGAPVPGETALISAALFAATTHDLNIYGVTAAAVFGAVIGDNLGYVIGRRIGLPLLLRYGPRIGVTENKAKLGRYLFAHYGAGVVFFGRFVALLRALAAFLAGTNRMPWWEFFGANLGGAVLWAGLFAGAAYALGDQVHKMSGPIGAVILGSAALVLIGAGVFIRRNEARLQARAEAEYPGPLDGPAGKI